MSPFLPILISILVIQYHFAAAHSGTTLDSQLSAAEASSSIITVKKDGSGDFKTVKDAVDSIPSGNARRWLVSIGGGEYFEKIMVGKTKPFVTFYGAPWDMPVIVFNGTAFEYGTMYSATVAVEADYFVAVNIVFKNSSPPPDGKRLGAQAVAMRISGDKAAFHGCRFIGFQDTLCDDKGRHFFHNCYIQGTVDFIFGDGTSLYMDSTIQSVLNRTGVITAQGRKNEMSGTGFTFVRCSVIGTGRILLGRAWRQSSRVVFAHTYMGRLVDPLGWSDFNYPDRNETVYYGEYKCWGPGAGMAGRVRYAKALSAEEVRPFLNQDYIGGTTWLLPPPNFLKNSTL